MERSDVRYRFVIDMATLAQRPALPVFAGRAKGSNADDRPPRGKSQRRFAWLSVMDAGTALAPVAASPSRHAD
jgi:hypothetical protein